MSKIQLTSQPSHNRDHFTELQLAEVIAEQRENFGQAHARNRAFSTTTAETPITTLGADSRPDLHTEGGSSGAEELSQTFLS